jgi:hypothetical protein
MKVGKRTQAYFVGFLIGVAIVSILIDFRRSSAEKELAEKRSWERTDASAFHDQPLFVRYHEAGSYSTAMQEVDGKGEPTGRAGVFFEDSAGSRYWLAIDKTTSTLCDGSMLEVESMPGLEFDLMVSGFEHQGHRVLSSAADAPHYRVGIDAGSAYEFVSAVENLREKTLYIRDVQPRPIDLVSPTLD